MEYLHFDETIIADFSDKTITEMYDRGYVFTRIGRGVMQQTRSIRIDLSKFEMSSENRRILKKGAGISLIEHAIPYADYSWSIGKMAKDFYDVKAGGAFSANKIKEIIATDAGNFNSLLSFTNTDETHGGETIGYAITYKNPSMIHYSYPFYDLTLAPKDMGLVMMTKIIEVARARKLRYVYLGSLQRPTDVYKLQFSGIEWFEIDGKNSGAWQTDIEKVKGIL
jgi:arginyl-tRNA--protein-N-Asp/Glu arginylyltransferase